MVTLWSSVPKFTSGSSSHIVKTHSRRRPPLLKRLKKPPIEVLEDGWQRFFGLGLFLKLYEKKPTALKNELFVPYIIFIFTSVENCNHHRITWLEDNRIQNKKNVAENKGLEKCTEVLKLKGTPNCYIPHYKHVLRSRRRLSPTKLIHRGCQQAYSTWTDQRPRERPNFEQCS